MHCVCAVELHVTLSVAQQCFYGKFMSQATISRTCVFK